MVSLERFWLFIELGCDSTKFIWNWLSKISVKHYYMQYTEKFNGYEHDCVMNSGLDIILTPIPLSNYWQQRIENPIGTVDFIIIINMISSKWTNWLQKKYESFVYLMYNYNITLYIYIFQ